MKFGGTTFTQGDDVWRKLRKKALNDLFFFNSFVLGNADKFPLQESTHRLLLMFADRTTGVPDIDDAPYQLLMWPRETGKSTCVTEARPLRDACRNPDTATLIANEKQETASDFIAAIKHHIETNELLRSLFPEIIPPNFNEVTWSATRASVLRKTGRPEPTFDCIGVGGTVTGKHYDNIICDDLISREAMENARSGNWTIMHKVNRWVNQLTPLLSKSAKPYPTITFIGTHWWYDDVYDHIKKAFSGGEEPKNYRIRVRLKDGRTVSREVYRAGNLAVMIVSAIENGRAVFPEIWSEERIEETMRMDPEFASCNLFNNPSNVAIRTFDDEWLHFWRYTDAKCDTIVYDDTDGQKQFISARSLYKIIAVDPAASSGTTEGARNAIVVLGTDQGSGKHFVLDVLADFSDPKDLIADIINMAQKWDTHLVHIELAGQQEYVIQWTEQAASQKGYALAVNPLKPGGRNKDLRIGGLVVPFKNGDIYVHASQNVLIADEFRHYRPGAKRRDVLDALAYAMEEAPKAHGGFSMSAAERSKAQLASYHRRLRGN